MPLPVETPRGGPLEPAAGGPPAAVRAGRIRRPRWTRAAGAVVATLVGIALLAAGIGQATGGLAGAIATGEPRTTGYARSQAPHPSAPASPATASPASASPATASQPPTPSPTPAPTPVGPGPGPTSVQLRTALLQTTLDRLRTKLGIPGTSVTIVFRDGSSWTGVSGFADVGRQAPVKPATAFAFASMSKTFTSALILQLVAEGRIRLTDSATTLLPALRKPIDRRITVAMLLDHTSGLHDFFLNPKIDKPLQSDPTRAWTTADSLGYVGKPYFAPGKGWHYSNTNYLLLGLIAERVTGQPLASAIRTRLLQPARLTTIWYQAVETPRVELAHGYRQPGTKVTVKPIDLADGSGVGPFRSVVTAAAGAGSLAGTSADLASWARRLYSGEVLGPAGTALLLGGFAATAAYHPSIAYGYGIQAVVVDGHASFGHSGRLLGFRGAVRHFPADGITIAVLTNQSRADPGAIVRALLPIAIPPPHGCPMCRIAR